MGAHEGKGKITPDPDNRMRRSHDTIQRSETPDTTTPRLDGHRSVVSSPVPSLPFSFTRGWFAGHTHSESLQSAGFRLISGGTHLSRTMMLAELRHILETETKPNPQRLKSLVLDENVLQKRTGSARRLTLRHLRELYGLGATPPISRAMIGLWAKAVAREWLQMPVNPNGRPYSDVLSPWWNGDDVTATNRDYWIVNFGEKSLSESTFYEKPFSYVERVVYPIRKNSRSDLERNNWWKLARRAPAMFSAIQPLKRFLVTPETSKHRVFSWYPIGVIPDKNLVVIAKDDDTALGILQSRFHAAWALRLGTSLEDRPRYTSTTTFRTFPFPEGLTPNVPTTEHADDPRSIAIGGAARRLTELREAWLNPQDLVVRVPEVVPGYPDRIVLVNPKAAAFLETRTLTNLYNERPAWLANAHRDLDAAVAKAYGWPADISEDEALERLLTLNLERAAASR